MNQDKLESAILELTEAIGDNSEAANALQLIVADYYLTKTQVIDLNSTINALGQEGPLSEVLTSTASKINQSLSAIEDISDSERQILRDLSEAQQNMNVAKAKMLDTAAKHQALAANAETLKTNVKNVIGGTLKSFLGPAAEFGPVKEIANQLFPSD